jgi:hypothetical protein
MRIAKERKTPIAEPREADLLRPPVDWLALRELYEAQTEDPRRWARADNFQKQRAIAFEKARSAGFYGPDWQSAVERDRNKGATKRQRKQAQCTV